MFLKFLSRVDLINHVVGVPSVPCVTCLVGDLRLDQRIAHEHLDMVVTYDWNLRLCDIIRSLLYQRDQTSAQQHFETRFLAVRRTDHDINVEPLADMPCDMAVQWPDTRIVRDEFNDQISGAVRVGRLQ